ncbi:CpaF family protein [Helcococcus ovis]|uniref:CpaF family protein n=1 Tax=Helcococcus ovis TaxID=72026 RepID=A0A4R9C166_9FIRM|nr:CpaF family protein [Helcococcus ovis]TFF64251.1 CpaF family protein [Helcococcus ovis]TFF66426.1 CpaF family protein [Helcococcus ovis]TFF66523.1 CpaF family protein [Helcococcus ovis]WNZ01680.1 CpaF family protein [Helcococcus ovis]
MIDYKDVKKYIKSYEIITLNDNQLNQYFNNAILNYCNAEKITIDIDEIKVIIKDLYFEYRGLSIIDKLLEDDEINEIMVNSFNNIFIEYKGKMVKSNLKFSNDEHYNRIIQKIVSDAGREVNVSNPIVDATLYDGSRVNIVLPPISKDNPSMTIRKFSNKVITIDDLIQFNTIDDKVAKFINDIVKAKYNLIISGGTSTGKTTFLNAISEFISNDERIITIEDSRELNLINKENLISLETRNSNNSKRGEINIKELIKTSLRMRPDRIIVGEVRADESLDMLQSMQTGHEGALTTIHANSGRDLLSRLETMVLRASDDIPLEAIKRLINSSIEIVIQLKRVNYLKRRVVEISEIMQAENGDTIINQIYKYNYKTDKLDKIGEIKNVEKLERLNNEK